MCAVRAKGLSFHYWEGFLHPLSGSRPLVISVSVKACISPSTIVLSTINTGTCLGLLICKTPILIDDSYSHYPICKYNMVSCSKISFSNPPLACWKLSIEFDDFPSELKLHGKIQPRWMTADWGLEWIRCCNPLDPLKISSQCHLQYFCTSSHI